MKKQKNNKNNYHFAIITPSYNSGKFIEATIKSVQLQKVELQHWIFDGGSKDQTVKVLKKFPKLLWKSESDKGQSDAINKGLKAVKQWQKKLNVNENEIIVTYLNADDFYQPNALSKVLTAFENNPKKMWLVGDCEIVDENGAEIQQPIRTYKKIMREVYSIFNSLILILNPFPQPAVFYRLSACTKIGNFSTTQHLVMDYEYWLKLYQQYGSPIIISDKIAAFRIHQQAKSTLGFDRQFKEQYLVAKKYTNNKIILGLHRLHNLITLGVYQLIK